MVKYACYKLFFDAIKNGENVFISANSKTSREVIDNMRFYFLSGVFYNWHDKGGKNIFLMFDKNRTVEQAVLKDDTLYILFGERVQAKDMAYTLLSAFYAAERKANGNNCNLVCV